jgi:hypothetical protein
VGSELTHWGIQAKAQAWNRFVDRSKAKSFPQLLISCHVTAKYELLKAKRRLTPDLGPRRWVWGFSLGSLEKCYLL